MLRKMNGVLYDEELRLACNKLPDNAEFDFLIVNKNHNRNLPSQTYLFSVVLKYLSDALPDHPSAIALYRYFEEKFAPQHTCILNGRRFVYRDLKSEKIVDFDNFIGRVIEYSRLKWNIEIPTKEELSESKNREFYSQAYLSQEVDWNSFISSKKA